MMTNLNNVIADGTLVGGTHNVGGKTYKVATMDNFSYTDPIDNSVSKNQVE